MYSNIDIMMMVKQEEIKEMRREAERYRLIKKAGQNSYGAQKKPWQNLLIHLGSLFTFLGKVLIKTGQHLEARYSHSQPKLVPEKNC